MKKLIAIVGFTMLLVMVMSAWAGDDNWAIKADYYETCSCSIPCPCGFGEAPNRGHCDANGLVEISEGHLGDIKLDGIKVAMSTGLGNWVKFYVSENATDEQAAAAVAVLRKENVFGVYYPETMQNVTTEKAMISVERTDTNVKFSTPFSNAEIEMMSGLDGNPIHFENLPLRVMKGHTLYKSTMNSHKSKDQQFEYSGTNASTSIIDESSGN